MGVSGKKKVPFFSTSKHIESGDFSFPVWVKGDGKRGF